MRFILLALGVLGVDQLSKWLVMTRMAQDESVPLINSIFYLTYVRNPGAAFGMLPYKTVFFIIVTLLILIGIVIFFRKIPEDRVLLRTGLALQVGGAVGNLIDRVRFGHVIDFFDFRVWPVFNVADIAIVLGVGILFIELLRSGRQEDGRESSARGEDSPS